LKKTEKKKGFLGKLFDFLLRNIEPQTQRQRQTTDEDQDFEEEQDEDSDFILGGAW
jgi:hypothetical protein